MNCDKIAFKIETTNRMNYLFVSGESLFTSYKERFSSLLFQILVEIEKIKINNF